MSLISDDFIIILMLSNSEQLNKAYMFNEIKIIIYVFNNLIDEIK
jgi:hypothetical protein